MAEVERLADHLVLMDAGRVIASGSLRELQSDPALPLVKARDAAISLDATVQSYDASYGLLTLAVDGGRFVLPGEPAKAGERRRLRIMAGDVSLTLEPPSGSTILNSLPARILSTATIGERELVVVLALGEQEDGARILRGSRGSLGKDLRYARDDLSTRRSRASRSRIGPSGPINEVRSGS